MHCDAFLFSLFHCFHTIYNTLILLYATAPYVFEVVFCVDSMLLLFFLSIGFNQEFHSIVDFFSFPVFYNFVLVFLVKVIKRRMLYKRLICTCFSLLVSQLIVINPFTLSAYSKKLYIAENKFNVFCLICY